jgi:hypothetical protein
MPWKLRKKSALGYFKALSRRLHEERNKTTERSVMIAGTWVNIQTGAFGFWKTPTTYLSKDIMVRFNQ